MNDDDWNQDDKSDDKRMDEDIPPARRRPALVHAASAPSEEVSECRALLGEIAHCAVMETAKKENRKPLLDERLDYEGYGGIPSVCRVRVYDPTPAGQRTKRPLVVVFTELKGNPGTSVTATFAVSAVNGEAIARGDRSANRIEHLANRMFERLGKPESVPVFVEHYPNTAGAGANRPQFDRSERLSYTESFAFVGIRRDESGTLRATDWKHTTRQTVEVITGQQIEE